MQLRCTYCQTMFAISREDMLAALEHMEENHQVYYDAHCPKCRRANRVERARMERFFPDWKTAIKTMAKGAAQAEAGTEKPAAQVETTKTTPAPKAAAHSEKKPAAKGKPTPAPLKKAIAKTSSLKSPASPNGKSGSHGSKKK